MLLITEKSISISTAFDGLFFLFWALFNVNNSTGGEKNLKIELISNKKNEKYKKQLAFSMQRRSKAENYTQKN